MITLDKLDIKTRLAASTIAAIKRLEMKEITAAEIYFIGCYFKIHRPLCFIIIQIRRVVKFSTERMRKETATLSPPPLTKRRCVAIFFVVRGCVHVVMTLIKYRIEGCFDLTQSILSLNLI